MCATLRELGRSFDYGCFNSKNIDSWDLTKRTSCPFSLETLFKGYLVAYDFIVAVLKKKFIFYVVDNLSKHSLQDKLLLPT